MKSSNLEPTRVGGAGQLWRCLTGIAMLAVFAYSTNIFGKYGQSPAKIQWIFVAVSSVLSLSVMVVRAVRWKILVAALGGNASVLRLMRIYFASFFLGAAIPGPVGDIARMWHVRKDMPSVNASIRSVVYDRLLDVALTIGAAFACGLLPSLEKMGWVPNYAAIAGVAAIAFGAFAFRRRVRRWWTAAVERMSRRFGQTSIEDISPLRKRTKVLVFALSVSSQGLWAIQLSVLAAALGINVGFWHLYGLCAIATVLAALPSIVGTREAVVAMLLAALGTGASDAAGFSFMCLLNYTVLVLVSAIAFFAQPLEMPAIVKIAARRDPRASTPEQEVNLGKTSAYEPE